MRAGIGPGGRTAVALMAKAPEAGKAKTRFCPPCTPDEAAGFARAFLVDSAAMVAGSAIPGLDAWCSYAGDSHLLSLLLPDSVRLLRQRGSGFDVRLSNTAADLFALRYSAVVLVGADCPTVDADYLRRAVTALEDSDVVIGPAVDGGYVLLGLRRPDPALFVGIEMGTDRVLAHTLQRAAAANYRVEVLDVRHDLDTVEDLLAAHAAGQLMAAGQTSRLLRPILAANS